MYTVLGRNQEPKNRYQFLQESIYVDEKKKKGRNWSRSGTERRPEIDRVVMGFESFDLTQQWLGINSLHKVERR